MAGFTDAPMRRLCASMGAERTYTEMSNARGLVGSNPGESQLLLETLPGETSVYAHLYGSEPDDFARAAEYVAGTGRFAGIDVNAGCPAPKVTRGGAGSALMHDPAKIGRIVAAVKRASGMPVSVKTRLGFSPSSVTVFDVLREVEDNGGDALSVHGRYRDQGHAGPVDFEMLAAVRKRANIPVRGNGGVRDAATASAFAAATGIDTLLVGQAAIGHPWVFREVADGVTFAPSEPRTRRMDLDEIEATLFAHLADEYEFQKLLAAKYPRHVANYTPEDLAVIVFKCNLFRYLEGMRGVSVLRGRLAALHSLHDVQDEIRRALDRERAFRARRP